MSKKHDAIAESIIRCEGLTLLLAAKSPKEGDLREARNLLKERIVKELDGAHGPGLTAAMTGDGL